MWTLLAVVGLMALVPRTGLAADGWDYLVDKLVADGIEVDAVRAAFDDPRMASFDGLEFSPERPRESRARYRQFQRGSTIAAARRCRARYADELTLAEKRTGVSANVIAAILFVETHCGQNTGSYRVFHRLARLAMANEPDNFANNRLRFADGDGWVDPEVDEGLRIRGRYLEDTFYPEVRASFAVAKRLGLTPLDLRGSPSGAFGHPQFLPTSYLLYAQDADGDGHASLHRPGDAALSAGNYLAAHGWRPGLDRVTRRRVIWFYNHSDAYVDTVLFLADQIAAPAPAKAKAKPKKKAKPKAQSAGKRR
jgi:membrane-bound lytic murein transglycosylase B